MTKRVCLPLLASLAVCALAGGETHKPKATTTRSSNAVIWRNPGAVEKLDFVGGPGGRSRAPQPPFTFVEEDMGGSNPKMKVTDARGTHWAVKWGPEVKAETFATRLAWAAGYFVEPAYYVAHGKIRGATGLKRAKKELGPDGSFTDARFELRDKSMKMLKDKGWTWSNNPFVGTRELNGLRIVMLLTSNWDNKDARDVDHGSNTGIFEFSDHRLAYAVTDWGGSMGKWGGVVGREKWDCEGYVSQTPDFIKGVKNDMVEWGYKGARTTDATQGISVADVRWSLQYLGRIRDAQIRAGLQASGATPAEVNCFAPAIRNRINQLRSVANAPAALTRGKVIVRPATRQASARVR